MIKKVPFAAIKFSSYERYKQLLTGNQGIPSSFQRFGAGALAALTGAVTTYPLDLIQTRFTVQTSKKPKYSSIYDCGRSIYKAEGIPGITQDIRYIYINI